MSAPLIKPTPNPTSVQTCVECGHHEGCDCDRFAPPRFSRRWWRRLFGKDQAR